MIFSWVSLSIAAVALVVILLALIIYKARDHSPLYIFLLIGLIVVSFCISQALDSHFILLLSSIAPALYLAWLARDELKPGRLGLWGAVLTGLIFVAFGIVTKDGAIIYAGMSVALIGLAGVILSFNPRWVRSRRQWESKV